MQVTKFYGFFEKKIVNFLIFFQTFLKRENWDWEPTQHLQRYWIEINTVKSFVNSKLNVKEMINKLKIKLFVC